MNKSLKNRMIAAAVLALGLVCAGAVSAAEEAGKVLKVVGRASAISPEGGLRRLDQGGSVNSGDIVVTAASSFVRLKLADGGYIVLRPNTRFQIEDYEFADKVEESRSVFNLLKGGFRAVTGLIGQRNKAAVRYRTAVATIGIRGTDLEVLDCADGCPDLGRPPQPGLYFKVHQGGIDVNGKPFDQGQGGYAPPGGEPLPISFDDPKSPLNSDPTPAANPDDC